jgi:Tol biopolymer transport system component
MYVYVAVDVYTYDLSGATRMQFLARGRFPIWTSDSKSVAFQSDDLAIWRQAYGGGTADRLTSPEPGESHEPESWSPKGDA